MIDYNVGDLVTPLTWKSGYFKQGEVCVVRAFRVERYRIGVAIYGKPGWWMAIRFRKLPKKSQEFFTGEGQRVPTDREMV